MTDSTLTPENTKSEKTEMPDNWRGELRALLVLGLPMAATQLVQFFIYTIDILMLGRIGAVEVAAAALGSVVIFALWMLGFGPVMAVTPLVSQALGANKHERHDVRISVRMTLWVLVFMLPFLILVVALMEPAALALGQDPEVSAKAQAYVWTLVAGWPFALGVMALRNFLAAIEKTTVPLILVIIGTSLNAFLNWLLIFGVGPFPKLELVGAGIASSLSYAFAFFLFVMYIRIDPKARSFRVFKRWWRPHWSRFRDVANLGWPISITTFFEGMLFNSAVLLMGALGIIEQAAYQVALNVVALAFMLPWGLSMAGSVRMGLAAGSQNREAKFRVAWTTIIAAVIGIGLFALPIAIWPDAIANLYLEIDKPDNANVIALVVSFLPIAAAFMLFDASQVAANQLLRGLKDVKWAMWASGISYWVIGFPVAFILGLYTQVGAVGIWYGLMAGLIAASIFLSLRLRWMLKRE